MASGPTYAQLRRAVYQMIVCESVYTAHGATARADECRHIAAQIMARMDPFDFACLTAEMAIAKSRRIEGVKVERDKRV